MTAFNGIRADRRRRRVQLTVVMAFVVVLSVLARRIMPALATAHQT